jgi:hypothetical protein
VVNVGTARSRNGSRRASQRDEADASTETELVERAARALEHVQARVRRHDPLVELARRPLDEGTASRRQVDHRAVARGCRGDDRAEQSVAALEHLV